MRQLSSWSPPLIRPVHAADCVVRMLFVGENPEHLLQWMIPQELVQTWRALQLLMIRTDVPRIAALAKLLLPLVMDAIDEIPLSDQLPLVSTSETFPRTGAHDMCTIAEDGTLVIPRRGKHDACHVVIYRNEWEFGMYEAMPAMPGTAKFKQAMDTRPNTYTSPPCREGALVLVICDSGLGWK